ncbi:G Protein, Alpha subunit [Caenorhabditis elegans]|uniref:G Protein, Alpha subunit n=1 Tax=Caenorhabditis elegans TaxID=6239 RepID=V6CLF3_CAEEL|nr:G Protein, Alpha subunit [Caenorhabditis elegans]CDK13395.1 G Protein, Alpha subunit [Caenorhabditis elegans]|eukprot:NP_001293718.1 G Protein, Alpha subunit [Caenorhabditis elegans]
MGSAGSVDRGPIRTLVLGCMGAGKTSFIRQMVKNHTKSICLRRELYLYCVQLNLLNIYRELKNVIEALEIPISEDQKQRFTQLDEYRHREVFPPKIIEAMKELFESGLYELCRLRQRILPLPQNYHFLFQRGDDFMNPEYVPSELEIMMSYSQTCGLNRENVTCQGYKFELLEMPGHHLWRAKWADYFDDPNLVVFVIDLSELCDPAFYNKGYLENKTVTVFESLVNNPVLAKVYWLLLFNKADTFNDHSAGFDFRKLANHLDTADSARSFYRSQFTTKISKTRCFPHIVSLVNESQSVMMEMFKKIGKMHRERPNLM